LTDPKTIQWKQKLHLYTTGVTANLLLKFRNFRYHGNGGRLSKVWHH